MWRERDEMMRDERRARLAAATEEFAELAKVACSGDLTLRSPGPAHWTLTRSRSRDVILQYWPSAEKVQLQGERKSRHCTLQQLRALLHDKLGCPPVLLDRSAITDEEDHVQDLVDRDRG